MEKDINICFKYLCSQFPFVPLTPLYLREISRSCAYVELSPLFQLMLTDTKKESCWEQTLLSLQLPDS